MVVRVLRARLVLALALVLALGGCAGDGTSDVVDDDAGQDGVAAQEDGAGEQETDEDDDAPAAATGGEGTITVDGHTMDATLVQCELEPQEAGPMTIELGVVAYAVDAEGRDISIDFGHLEEPLPGDSVELVIDVTSPDAPQFHNTADGIPPVGTVTVEGSSISATDLTLQEDAGGSDQRTVSFDLEC